MSEFDLIVIGGGPGGYIAALEAVKYGKRVAIIEKDRFGGACLFRGCIPTKSFYSMGHRGVAYGDALTHKNTVVETLASQVERLMKKDKITVYTGSGKLTSENSVTVNDSETITGGMIIIATGSRPIIPESLDVDSSRKFVMTSDEVVHLEELPKKILVIGGGYIGCEYASILSSYGVSVTLVEATDAIMRGEDVDVVNMVSRLLEGRGVSIEIGEQIDKLVLHDNEVSAHFKSGLHEAFDKVLVAIGRRSNIDGIGLEEVDVKTDAHGIIVNDMMQSSVSHIYGIGDVISKPMRLAHVAEHEARTVVGNVFGGAKNSIDYSLIPTTIFTSPEIASIGFREKDLKEQGKEYVVGKSIYKANPMAYCEGSTEGIVKVLVDPQTREILGATIVSDHANELLGAFVVAKHGGVTVDALSRVPWFHPSRTEAFGSAIGMALSKLAK